MTPTQIVNNQQALSNYTYSIQTALADYAALYASRAMMVDRTQLKDHELRLKLLAFFVGIAIDYMSPTMEGDTNFFDADQFNDIQQHINNLAGTNYYLTIV